MNREAVAKAIYELNPEIQLWDGDAYSFEEGKALINDRKVRLAYAQADATLSVLALESD